MQSWNSGAHFNLPFSPKNLQRVRQLVDGASNIISRFQVALVAESFECSHRDMEGVLKGLQLPEVVLSNFGVVEDCF